MTLPSDPQAKGRDHLHPDARAFLERLEDLGAPPPHEQTPEAARAAYETASPALCGPPPPVAAVDDLEVAGADGPLIARRYRPTARADAAPALLWLHGGGWVLGSLDSYDVLCRHLALTSGGVVINVDYRLAPEHPFPAAPRDAIAATRWVLDHAREIGIDPRAVAVGGDSAGGALAAVVARHSRAWPLPLCGQLLVYPIVDAGEEWPSFDAFADGHYLTREGMRWYWSHYAPDPRDRTDPDAAPLRAPDLTGAPPACVVLAECDVLRDPAIAYTERLRAARVPVDLHALRGHLHGFLRWTAVTGDAGATIRTAGAALREWWRASGVRSSPQRHTPEDPA